jgi:hypothetical protein
MPTKYISLEFSKFSIAYQIMLHIDKDFFLGIILFMENIPEGNARYVIQRLVDKIISGIFDDIDIRALLFELRGYSNKDTLFRELAHFIAHPGSRDQGKFRDYIISYSKHVKFVWDYRIKGNSFNYFQPFPLYVLECIFDVINSIDKTWLQNNFNIVPRELKRLIKKNVIINGDTNIVYFDNSISSQLSYIIDNCINLIGIKKEILTQKMIIDDIILTLDKNKINFSKNEFTKNSNRIMLCILLVLHLQKLKIDTNNQNQELPYCSILFDKIGNKDNKLFLGIYGILNIPENNDIMKVAFPLISTELLLAEYCDDNLLHDIENSDQNNEITRPLQFSNFKLAYSTKTKENIKDAVIFIFRLMNDGKYRVQILSAKDAKKHKDS